MKTLVFLAGVAAGFGAVLLVFTSRITRAPANSDEDDCRRMVEFAEMPNFFQ